MSETDALAFIRDALTDMRTDVRDLRHAVEQSIRDADSRFEALETCPCPRAGISAPPAAPTGIAGFLASYSWLPTAAKLAWPIVLVVGVLWTRATPETKTIARQVAASSTGLPLDQLTAASTRLVITPASSTWTVKQADPR